MSKVSAQVRCPYPGSGRVRVLRERFGHEAVRGRVDGVGDNAARQRVLKDAR